MDNPFKRYQSLLTTYIDNRALPVLYNNWVSSSRHYHTLDHLDDVIKHIEKFHHRFTQEEFEQLILAAFFHDAIYNPMDSENNEDKSIKFFREAYTGKDRKFTLVDDAIECTKHRKRPTSFPLQVFWDADNAGFRKPWLTFLKYDKQIEKEYAKFPRDKYKKGRIEFLKSNLGLFGPRGDTNINKLIKYLDDK